jgi:hypothetical protein
MSWFRLAKSMFIVLPFLLIALQPAIAQNAATTTVRLLSFDVSYGGKVYNLHHS